MFDDTIAAVATAVAAGAGSVAIVRLSGPQAEAIGRRLFVAPGQQCWESHRVLYGHVVDPATGERVDEALLLLMKAPRSFTREDVVELHCHGGLICVQRVLELVLAAGARRAGAGEFSQRAFLNGRLDLTRAEAVSELVTARSRRAAQLAMAGLDGGLQRRIGGLRERLLDQLAELEARVDFEEDLPPLDAAAVVAELEAVRGALLQLVADAQRGQLLREGLKVAIVGRPNVGKSSLLNRLSRTERAIVTDLPGTTRDLVESELVIQGVPLTLLDTAGIRATDDRVEQLGIARSRAALAAADVVLLLFDLEAGWTAGDQELREQVPPGVPLLVVGNKADLAGGLAGPAGAEPTAPAAAPAVADACISALSGAGQEHLEQALLRRCGHGGDQGLQVALNRRQHDLAAAAAAALARSLEAAQQQLPWDFWTIDLRAAARALGEITGEEINEAVLDRVFARFCIGK
ncbi:tRNA uridine-5-carboxymethylaminomethyl(34) synthesis GTPase MnmE [Vulcanococcus limneticus]|uniref:tRNA uridine-5-carboxymethylaminomethyl(34) synthesis GTPase MnmE n=1 Tax=Vulcanococcus limneticus TaxID=2170428 RepID=UPI000B988710|nr:tRNA uridine-5-carboxymethylaminomethyl(34) synthesis GTPase MnmE [Vulcanococcus limneticus]MCP9792230.1 tRNA uridine-5-carboxymethylaminomethyl(34) synthesis GTPase MnmE [Vulcanococcus limneticus MW73D5]MCP9897579.1 tRNA uridine-5-carboxymethylaminomethyl(34) synthesis GTPase MnmE [Vulcanococcus limneticus Candia 3B3]